MRVCLYLQALGWRVPCRPTTAHLQCVPRRSRHDAPNDRASVGLLETVREAEADSQCVFVSACRHSGGECLPPHDYGSALIVCCNGAAMTRRLMKQARGCSLVCVRVRGRRHLQCVLH